MENRDLNLSKEELDISHYIYPQILPGNVDISNANSKSDPVRTDFNGFFQLEYRFSCFNHKCLISTNDMHNLGYTPKTLHDLSMKNLLNAFLGEANLFNTGDLYMFSMVNQKEASLILVDEIWNDIESMVDGNLVLSIPANDIIMFTGINSILEIERMLDISQEAYYGDKGVCDTIFMRENSKWTPLIKI